MKRDSTPDPLFHHYQKLEACIGRVPQELHKRLVNPVGDEPSFFFQLGKLMGQARLGTEAICVAIARAAELINSAESLGRECRADPIKDETGRAIDAPKSVRDEHVGRICQEIDAGFHLGRRTGYHLFSELTNADLVRLSRLKEFRALIFVEVDEGSGKST